MTQDEITKRLDALEAKLEDQQATIESQQEQIEEQEAVIEEQREQLRDQQRETESQQAKESPESDNGDLVTTRRGVLTTAGLLGLLGLGAGSASADTSGQIGTSSDPLQDLYTAQINGSGSGLTVTTNGNGNLTLDPGSGNNLVLNNQQSNDASLLTIDGSGNVGKGSKSISDIGSGGSSSTLKTSNGNLALEVIDTASAPAIVGGSGSNQLNNNPDDRTPAGAVITGGGHSSSPNIIEHNWATIAGGIDNKVTGSEAIIPGGRGNRASGDWSFCAGRVADANNNNGAFVWGDSSSTTVTAGATDEVRFQATGGFVVENGRFSADGMEVFDGGTNSAVSASSDSSTPPNIINGHPSNNTGGNDVKGVTIAGGGGDSGSSNNDNAASANWATVGGGKSNTASDTNTTVAGGNGNSAKNSNATVAGGFSCTADGYASTVGGGTRNDALGWNATVPGGSDNVADGEYSFAAGRHAETGYNDGTFVWADSSDTTFTASATDEVRFQATGGFVIAPRLDKTTMLDVQDKDGYSLLTADTTNHKVQVFDGDATDSVDISHGGSAGEISTSTGHLKLNPFGNVELDGSDIISSDGFDISTNDGDLKLDAYSSIILENSGALTKPIKISGGPFTRPTTSQSSEYDLDDNQEKYFVEVDTSSTNVTIHLPDSPSIGEEHVIKKSASGNTLTIDADNETIDGSTTIELTNQYAARKVIWGGSNWHVTGEVAGQSPT